VRLHDYSSLEQTRAVAVHEFEGRTYFHITQDPAQPDAQRDVPAKAREQRHVAVNEARNLLKNPEKLCTESPKEVLDALHNAAYKLSLSMRKALFSGKANTARNYRRKRSQVKGLYAALTDCVAQDTPSDEESHGFVYPDPVDTLYMLSMKEKRTYELKRLIRNAIMNEFWTRTMRRLTHFPGCKPLIMSQPAMLVSVNHITTEDNTKNKFAALSSEVSALHSDQLQQQFQQLQAQMRQLEQQLHGHESTTHTGGGSIRRSPGRPSYASERYRPAGGRFVYQSRDRSSHEAESSRQGSTRYNNSSYPPQYDRRTLGLHRGSPPWLYNDTR
jgi:hypothetical protein